MNKILMFPLAIMLLLTIFSVLYTGEEYITDTIDMSEIDSMQLNGTDTGGADLTVGESQEFDMWGLEGALLILIIAIAIGTVAGIKVLGSGLSDESVHILFSSTVFLGLWGVLSIVSIDFMFSVIYTVMLWLVLTIMYVIGVTISINGTGG